LAFKRTFLFFALAVVCLLSLPWRKSTADEWQPIDPAELKMTSEPKAPGAPAIYLYRQVDRKDSGHANTEYNYVRLKVLTEQGRDFANVAIPYLNDTVHISGIRARTVHSDGTVVNFEGKPYDKIVEKSKTLKIKAKVFTAPDVQVGSIVEYHFNYDFEDGYVFNSYWVLSDELFTKKAAFSLVPYKDFAVRWQWPAGLPAGTEPPKQEPNGVVRMTAVDIPAFETEDFMPPPDELKFRVEFIYTDEPSFESDPVKYWRKFGKKQNERLESFLGKKRELEAAAGQIVSANDAPEVKLRKIYDRVQALRNLSYEPVKAEEQAKRENQKKVENAADLLKLGYGNGRDLTWLFVGLARGAGFQASGALVAARSRHIFNEKRMNSEELDSNVALVKLDGKDLYFDPGAAFVPYGLLPWQETAARGMKLDKEGGTWIDTPLPESADSQIQRKANLKLTQEGALEGNVTLTYTGLEACLRRVQERNEDEQARKKYLEDELQSYVPAASEVELRKQPEWKNSGQPLVAEFSFKVEGWVSGAGKRAMLPVGLFSAPEKQLFTHTNRTHAIFLDYPYEKKDDVTIELPTGWVVGTVPSPLDRDAKAAEYKLTVTADSPKTTLHIDRSVRSQLLALPKDSYVALRSFFELVRSGDDEQVVLQPGSVSAGK
jgi:Domain of Unknown Function with PDB structure (DUF3857)